MDRMITLGLNSHPQLIINDSPWLSPSKLYSVCKHFKSISKLDIIIIDYFQLMQVNTELTTSRSQKLALMIDSLKKIANKLQLTIILLSDSNYIAHRPSPNIILNTFENLRKILFNIYLNLIIIN